MGKDYNEIICTAIDEIVTARLQGLQYDITKLCTVIDDTSSYQGKYIVSDGSIKFEAYSIDTSYKKGNNVLVVIPNGDYNMQKTISGRVAATNTAPFNYKSPMDTMVKITNNIFDNSEIILGDNNGLVANDNGKSSIIGPIYSITESGDFAGFTRLGISADFRSWLTGLDVVTGVYGLKVLIYTDTLDAPGSIHKNSVYELTFNSTDMIGNPYQFESYFYQEQVFDISHINNINKIEIYFYQDGQFTDGTGTPIAWQYEDGNRMLANLFVNNIKIYLGYESGKFTEETLMLFTSDSLTYHYQQYKPYTDTDLIKTVSLRWIHKISENEFQLLNGNNLDAEKFEIRWFKYHAGYDIIDQYAGKDWERVNPLQDDAFSYCFSPSLIKQTEQIKVIGFIKEQIIKTDGETQSTIEMLTPYYSNLLVFENEEEVPDVITVNASNALTIVCMDGSEGNYFLYDQNGAIIDEGQGQGYLRTVEARYNGAMINKSLGKIDYLKWYFPDEIHGGTSYTMILNDISTIELADYCGIDYVVSERNDNAIDELTGDLNTAQTYSIKNYFNLTDANNTIRCILSINGVEYEATKELLFGKAGTNGSNATFVLSFKDNKDALIAAENEQISVKAQLYDINNSRVGLTEIQAKNIEWSWHRASEQPLIEIQPDATDGACVILNYLYDENTINALDENYHILKARYAYNGVGLEAYLPIPIKKDKKYTQFEGAKQVIYNHSGTPTYYPKEYKLHEYVDGKHEEVQELTWTLKYFGDTSVTPENDSIEAGASASAASAMTESLIPKLKNSNTKPGYVALSASTFYVSGLNDKVCVSCTDANGNILWSQPILILQSQYDFAMLNSWNGGLTIDEENGTILSTMLGAGRKNIDNTFSGVLIGDIQQGTELDDANNMTGVYGYHHGVQSYSLKEDGTATFGKAGKGQIIIDGDNSIITSANYMTEQCGTKLNLESGLIHILGDDTSEIKLQPNAALGSYFNITSNTHTPLINIGIDGYFLQSNNYTNENAQGSKMNLSNGDLEIKSPYGRTYLSGGNDAKYFEITVPPLSNGKPGVAAGVNSYITPLLTIGQDEYFLQSINFAGLHFNTTTIDDITYNLYNSGLVAVSFDGKIIYTKADVSSEWIHKTFTDTTEIITYYDDSGKEVEKEIIFPKEKNQEAYLATLTPYYSQTQGAGLKMDLSNGIINGYDLLLKGTKSDDNNKTIIIDSSSSTTPLRVGSDFSVNWDGTLTCNKLNSLNNDQRDNYAISISNNFYVTQSGGAGGSGVSFSGGFSGIMKGKGIFNELTVGEPEKGGIANFYGNIRLPTEVQIGNTEFRSRTNTFVTGINKFEAEPIAIVTSVKPEKNQQEIHDGEGYVIFRKEKVVTDVTVTPGTAVKKITLTLSTLRGAYFGSTEWDADTISKSTSA